MTITQLAAEIETLLQHEERLQPITSLVDLENHQHIRRKIGAHIQTILTTIHRTQQRVSALPPLPELQEAYWARAMLEFPNLAFLEVDTDGLGIDANVVRVLLLGASRQVLFDSCIQSPRPLSDKLLTITGLTREQMEQAPPVERVWPSFLEALRGRYLLSYNLEFDQAMLQALADRTQLRLPYLVAECLMKRAANYFHLSQYPKLADLCQRFGHPLAAHPEQTARHRALGQFTVLWAMAQGLSGPLPNSDNDEDEENELPF